MRFNDLLEKSMPDLIRDLQGCIRIPSLYQADDSGYPYGKPVQECLEYTLKLAESLGFRVHNMDNQLGWAEFGEGEEMVAVLGHLDVVPEGDGWTVDPYGGEVKDGRIYGRGTMDDKGPTITALYALKAIKDSGVKINRRIRVIFGLNEETGSADMKYYATHARHGLHPRRRISRHQRRKGPGQRDLHLQVHSDRLPAPEKAGGRHCPQHRPPPCIRGLRLRRPSG